MLLSRNLSHSSIRVILPGDSMRDIHYQLLPDVPGVFAEVYLPKNPHLQGILYDTLNAGLDINTVRAHFRSNRSRLVRYLQKAQKYYEVPDGQRFRRGAFLSDRDIARMPDLFAGYSMYEVDGVWRSTRRGKATVSERTQVLRLMFICDLSHSLRALPFIRGSSDQERADLIVRAYLRSYHWDPKMFLDEHLGRPRASLYGFQRDDALKIVNLAAEWARFVGIFLSGYVVYNLCQKIGKLAADRVVKPEHEIWITFFWNLGIRKVVMGR